HDGEHRVWHNGALNHDWNGTWTLVGFSVPESWRPQRHDLRSRLTWAGFGPLQNGLWIAPGHIDVPTLLHDLDLSEYLKVFTAHTAKPTEADQIVHTAYDLPAIADRYHAFLRRWDHH
ncbi:PaaX family transcriptional regulator, partial [Saccharothrix sp. NRRL B-16348]